MKAMVLAAGEGTRMRPLTDTVPKPMLPVAGRPTLEWIFAWLRYHGVEDIVVNLCHQPEPVIAYFGDGRDFGVRLTFSVERALLGTAGGMKRVERQLQDKFVIVYGDVLTDMDLGRLMRFHEETDTGPHLTLSLCRASNPWECGVVAVDERRRVTRFVEKPPREEVFSDLTNAGVLVCDPALLDYVPTGQFYDISSDLLPRLLAEGVPVYAPPVDESIYLIDIGTPEKYARVQGEWSLTAAYRSFVTGTREPDHK